MSATGASRIRWLLVFGYSCSVGSLTGSREYFDCGSSFGGGIPLSQVRLGWVFTAFLLGYALFQTLADGWSIGSVRGESLPLVLSGGESSRR